MASANNINKTGKFTELVDTIASDLAVMANEAKHGGKKIVQALDETVKELLTPAGDKGLGIKVKIPKKAADEIRDDTKSLMVRKGEIREGRLCEGGSKRRPYKWPVINERFSDDVVRQSHDLSCTSAVGEMLTDGAFTEDFLLDKIGPNAFLDLLAKALGPPWTDQRKKNLDISLITTRGPMGVTLKEGAFKNHHSLVVDGVSPSGNLKIRDPWEGTKYEMEFHIFLEYWTGHAIYKSE